MNKFTDDIEGFLREIQTPESETDLAGTGWSLILLYGETPLEDTAITLEFVDVGKAAGSSGCNRYMTTYAFDAASASLSFGRTAGTMMACPEPQMAQEQRYLEALARTQSFAVKEQTLALLDEDGRAVAEFVYVSQSLAGTSWEVIGYNNGKGGVVSVISGTELTLNFGTEGRVLGSSGCNTYYGPYATDGETVSIGPLAGTRRMCFGEGVMEQEAMYLAALQTAAVYRISGNRMEMRRGDGALAVNLKRE